MHANSLLNMQILSQIQTKRSGVGAEPVQSSPVQIDSDSDSWHVATTPGDSDPARLMSTHWANIYCLCTDLRRQETD